VKPLENGPDVLPSTPTKRWKTMQSMFEAEEKCFGSLFFIRISQSFSSPFITYTFVQFSSVSIQITLRAKRTRK
jgi:hypothetical protein